MSGGCLNRVDGSLSGQSEDVSRQGWGQTRQDTHPHADPTITAKSTSPHILAAGSRALGFVTATTKATPVTGDLYAGTCRTDPTRARSVCVEGAIRRSRARGLGRYRVLRPHGSADYRVPLSSGNCRHIDDAPRGLEVRGIGGRDSGIRERPPPRRQDRHLADSGPSVEERSLTRGFCWARRDDRARATDRVHIPASWSSAS